MLPKGTPFTALTTCLSPRCSSGLRTPRWRKTPSSVPNTCSFCLLGTTRPQPTMPRDVGFAPPPSLHLRSGVAFSCPQKDRFTKDAHVSFPLAAEGSLIRCSTTIVCGESTHQTRSTSCKPKAKYTCWDSKTTSCIDSRCARSVRTCPIVDFSDTIALNRMSRCRSGTCRLLSDSCQPFGPFASRCFAVAVGLYIQRRPNTDVSRKIGGLASRIQKETRESCFLELQKPLLFCI